MGPSISIVAQLVINVNRYSMFREKMTLGWTFWRYLQGLALIGGRGLALAGRCGLALTEGHE